MAMLSATIENLDTSVDTDAQLRRQVKQLRSENERLRAENRRLQCSRSTAYVNRRTLNRDVRAGRDDGGNLRGTASPLVTGETAR